ncbi:MAG: right-handed parallel beta-helix repeat-containing protein [Nitrospira sp.]|nr:right-handed parallel beta-helix repeat-containing protein [Nitrospira sp.]
MMKFLNKLYNQSMVAFLLCMLFECTEVLPAHAVVNLYLDPDWTGAQSGTQTQPFASFSAGAWSTINAALATDNVTVYLSAREAGSDTDDVLNASIDITQKTPNPTGVLTINGNSFYNSSDSGPTWVAYGGQSKARVNAIEGQNDAHIKYNKVTIDGVHIVQNSGTKGLSICGDNWTVKNSNIEHGPNGGGALVLIVPTADSAHEGSSAYCPASANITIQNNTIHDSVGELIYVGGAGCSTTNSALSSTSCNGVPSHSNISILNNTLTNCGSRASQGDCIDMKGGLANVTIRGNNISNAGAVARAIVGQGTQTNGTNQNIIIERNYIHDLPDVDDAAIAVVNSWGTPNGYMIRNNIIDTVNGGGAIHVYGTQSAGVKVFNNTIYNASGSCISSDSGSTLEVRNNACLSNNSGGNQTALAGSTTSTNNAYSGSWGGTCTNCVPGLSTIAFKNSTGGDFTLVSGSLLTDVGASVTSFSDDYIGTSRPQGTSWDIGAYELNLGGGGNAVIPPSPTNLTVQ